MGTYTTNYQLYMPTIGEQGWGDLVNGNFITIDTTMKGLDTRIGALETAATEVEERVTSLEAGEFESDIKAKLNVSSLSTTGDLRIIEFTFPTDSGSAACNSSSNLIVNCGTPTITRYNTSILNFTGSLGTFTSTCTVTVSVANSQNYLTLYITVTDTTTGSVVLNTSNSSGSSSFGTRTFTFERNPDHNYKIETIFNSNSNSKSYSVTTSTPNISLYVS